MRKTLRALSVLPSVCSSRRRRQRAHYRPAQGRPGGCISLTGGHGDSDYLSPDKAALYPPILADTPDDIERAVRRDIKYGADWIKLMATGGVMDPISDYRVQELERRADGPAVESRPPRR